MLLNGKGEIVDKRIMDRVLKESSYILDTGDTIRQIAEVFGVSKSTVHKDLNERLLNIDYDIYKEVNKVLMYHTLIRHIIGGESTRQKFLEKG